MVGYAYEARPYRTQSHAIPDIRYEYSNSLIGIANIISYTVYAYIYIILLPKCYQFYQSKIASLEESSSRDWWKQMKNLMGASSGNTNEMQGLANKSTNGDMAKLVNSMNEFVVSVSEDLPRLQPSHPVFDVREHIPAEFIIDVACTQTALAKVKCNKATGPDNIPPWMLKNYSHLLAAPTTAIFNSSLREGMLPELWKTATVIPLPKKHPPDSLENDIRPISLTPILAKVFESIVLKWVDNFVLPYIDARQFGGIAGTGATDALVEMVHKWSEATDKPGTFVRVLFIDYSKAFDLINHELLITKLVDVGLPAHLVRWLAAFLINRQQVVKIGDVVSNTGYPKGGVPQGTLSGPKNFLVHINDLQTQCPMYKYVDDITVFDICNNDRVSILQQSVDVITNWTRDNDMRVNTTKTKEMMICFCRDETHVTATPTVVIDGNTIERVTQAKVLGVTISADLSWNAHVDAIVCKARKRVFIIYQLKRAGISQSDLLRIYVSVIRPVMEYACQVWHTSLPDYLSDNIETIQKRCLRTIFPGYSYGEARIMSNLPTLQDRRTKLCKLYFRKLTGTGHKLNPLLPDQRNMSYCLRTSNTLPVPLARTDRYRRSLIPWGLANWKCNVP